MVLVSEQRLCVGRERYNNRGGGVGVGRPFIHLYKISVCAVQVNV